MLYVTICLLVAAHGVYGLVSRHNKRKIKKAGDFYAKREAERSRKNSTKQSYLQVK